MLKLKFCSKDQLINKRKRNQTYVSTIGLLLTFFIFYVFGFTIHEYWHLRIADCFGVVGTINYSWFGGVFMPDIIPSEPSWFIIKIAGGLGTAIVMFLLWAYARWTYSRWDMNIEFAAASTGAYQLSYSIAEGFFFESDYFYQISTIFALVGFIIVLIKYLYPIYQYVNYEKNQIHFFKKTS